MGSEPLKMLLRSSVSIIIFVLVTVEADEGCHTINEWSYAPPGGKDLLIYGIKYKDSEPNNAAFTVFVHGADGKNVCTKIDKGKLKPGSDGWIYAACESGTVVGRKASLTARGLRVCGKDLILVGTYKPDCPTNSKAVGTTCVCNPGYEKSGKACIKVCPEHSRAVNGKCHCDEGFEMGADNKCHKSRGYCRRDHADCPGHDIRHIGSTTEDACMKICDHTPGCRSIHHRENGNCWLKRYVCANRELTPRIKGTDFVKVGPGHGCARYTAPTYKFCKRPMHYCSGGDITHRHPVPRREMCELWCRYHRDCVSYHYKEDQNCWLERRLCTNDQLVPELPSADYVKVPVGESCKPYQPEFKYCTRRMMECAGYDLEHRGGIDSLERCQTLCNYSDRCTTVHWREDRNCWLKYKVCTNDQLIQNIHGYDSVKMRHGESCHRFDVPHFKFCKRPMHYCAGGDIAHRHPVPHRRICEHWCRYHPKCVSYHYKQDKNCWLEGRLCTNDQLVPELPSADYVKVPVHGSCEPYQPRFKYCTRRHAECAGFDLEHRGGIDSLERCQKLCDYSSRCNTVHWREDQNCWLKYKVCTNNEIIPNVKGYDSVKMRDGRDCHAYEAPEYKFCKRSHRYCPGGDIHHRGLVPRREMCELWCRYNSNCVSYHYKNDQNCWLERRLCRNHELVHEVPSNDYVKVALRGSCADYRI